MMSPHHADVRKEALEKFEGAVRGGADQLQRYVEALCSEKTNVIIRCFISPISWAVKQTCLDEEPTVALRAGEHASAWSAADLRFQVTLLDERVSRRQKQQLADLTARALSEDVGFSYHSIVGKQSISLQPLTGGLPTVDIVLRLGHSHESRQQDAEPAALAAFQAAVCLNSMQHLYDLPRVRMHELEALVRGTEGAGFEERLLGTLHIVSQDGRSEAWRDAALRMLSLLPQGK